MSETNATYSYAKGIIEKYSLELRKSLGQNFLIDQHVLGKILHSADISGEDTVIEVGPGIGALTRELCKQAKKVYAIEIDKALIPVLSETLSEFDNLSLVNEDVLKIDFNSLLKPDEKKSVKLVANLPYYITTPIIMGILEDASFIKSITVMVQKEVGERMRAKPSTKAYGSLTLSVAYYSDVELAANVPANCFMPRPAVDSCVIKLDILKRPRIAVNDKELFFKMIKAAFSKRRKTLLNCLTSYDGLETDRQRLLLALRTMKLSESVRGEAMDINQFAELYRLVYNRG